MDPTEQLEIETRIGEALKSIYDPEIPVIFMTWDSSMR